MLKRETTLIAYLKNRLFSNRLQLRGVVHHTFYIQLFLYIQLSSLLSHIADRRFIFRINSSPSNTRISLFHFNLTGVYHILLCKRTFDIA